MKNKIVVINGSDFGSTGKISLEIISYVQSHGEVSCDFLVSNKKTNFSNVFCIDNNKVIRIINKIIVKVFGSDGFRNIYNTRKIINSLKKEKIDLIHIHSLHGYYINFPMLFKFINKNKIPVIWTLHDNWIYSGRCAFIPEKCFLYKDGCKKCKYHKIYPRTIFDRANYYYKRKHKILKNTSKIIFVSPSKWNANLRYGTFLENHEFVVINNGIDLSKFSPTKSNLRHELNIDKKFVILCIAYPWNQSKGLNYINQLAEELDTSKFVIVMVGVDDQVITHQNIIRIGPIFVQEELAKYYSMADVFLSPTTADNYPTVAMESISCGCPVIFFDAGGIKEIVGEEVGILVPKNDYEGIKNAVLSMYINPFSRETCIDYSKRYDKEHMLQKYYDLYMSMIEKGEK